MTDLVVREPERCGERRAHVRRRRRAVIAREQPHVCDDGGDATRCVLDVANDLAQRAGSGGVAAECTGDLVGGDG
jgi:hypothetical protein